MPLRASVHFTCFIESKHFDVDNIIFRSSSKLFNIFIVVDAAQNEALVDINIEKA